MIQKRSCESEDDRRLGIRRSDSGRRFDESDETMQCDEKLPRSNCVWYNGTPVDWNSLDQVKLEVREERCRLADDSANIKRKYESHESHEGA